MRIGVAGIGRIGSMHARHLASLDVVDEVVLYDLIAGRTESPDTSTTRADTFDDLLASCDGVVLATPTDTHPELVRRAIAAGVPALCEKPVAAEEAEMESLVADVEAVGVPVLVGFQRRFDPAMVELHRRVTTGGVGTVYQVRTVGLDAEPPDFAYLPASGGIFRDLLIHDLDAVPWLVDEPVVRVYASGSVLVHGAFAEADDVDTAVVVLQFAGGAHALMSAGRHNPLGYDHRIEVHGSHDSLTVGLNPLTPLTSLDPDGPAASADAYPGFPERFHAAYVNEMRVFLDVIAGTADNPSPVRDSLVSLRLAIACERSRRTGAPVDLARSD